MFDTLCLHTEPTRHVQDSRMIHASLKSEDAVPGASSADARMHMHVLDKLMTKRKSLRDVYVRMHREGDGQVTPGAMRQQ